jgi:hypothetical protein
VKVYLPALNDLVPCGVPQQEVLRSAVSLVHWLMMEGPLSWDNHHALLRLLLELRVEELPTDLASNLSGLFQRVRCCPLQLLCFIVCVFGLLCSGSVPGLGVMSRSLFILHVDVVPDAACCTWT